MQILISGAAYRLTDICAVAYVRRVVLGPSREEPAHQPADRLEKAADLLRALAAPVRLAVVSELGDGQRCVHELQDRLSARGRGISQPLLSQHLKVLRDAGLVIATRRGQERAYALVDAHVAHIVTAAVNHAHEQPEEDSP